jgi:hypothetical protein
MSSKPGLLVIALLLAGGGSLAGCGSSRSGPYAVNGQAASASTASTNPQTTSTAATTPTATTTATTTTQTQVTPTPVASADLIAVIATEVGAGGAMPPPGSPPRYPTITFQATFQNTGNVDLDSTDPTLGVMVQFFDPASPAQVVTKVVPLGTSIAAGAQASEVVYGGNITTLMGTVDVSVALVSLDARTGAVLGYVSPNGPPVSVKPFILLPP